MNLLFIFFSFMLNGTDSLNVNHATKPDLECTCFAKFNMSYCSNKVISYNEVPVSIMDSVNKYLTSNLGEKLFGVCRVNSFQKVDTSTCGGVTSYYLCYTLNITEQAKYCIGVSINKKGNIDTNNSFNYNLKNVNTDGIISFSTAVYFAKKHNKEVKWLKCTDAGFYYDDKNQRFVWSLTFFGKKRFSERKRCFVRIDAINGALLNTDCKTLLITD